VFNSLSAVVAKNQTGSQKTQIAIREMPPLSMEVLARAHKLTVALNKDTLAKARCIWFFQLIGSILVIVLIAVDFHFINIPMFRRIEEIMVLADKYAKGLSDRTPPEKI
jgi:hypothetical protein